MEKRLGTRTVARIAGEPRIPGDERIVSPELLLVQMSRIATPVELAMLVCELCGLYSVRPGAPLGMTQREHPLTSTERIHDFIRRLGAVPGVRKLRAALALSFDRSGSPMESKLAARVSWPRSKGGYNVPIISMNQGLEVARVSRNLSRSRVRKPDLLFSLPREEKPGICLDYHGDVHHGGTRPEQDAARMNELLAFGLRPYTLWREQYRGTAYLDGLIDGVVRRELGLPRPRAAKARDALELARREALLAELDAVDGMSWGTSGAGAEAKRALELVDEAKKPPLGTRKLRTRWMAEGQSAKKPRPLGPARTQRARCFRDAVQRTLFLRKP